MKTSKVIELLTKKGNFVELLFYASCFLLTAIFVYSRGQDINWDLLNYHYYSGYSLLNGRLAVDIAATGIQTFLNPVVNVFSYLHIEHLPFPFSVWTAILVQLASVPAIVLLAKEIGGHLGHSKSFIPAIPAVVLSMLSPLWASELGTTFFSSLTAPLVIWAVYCLFCAFSVSGFLKKHIVIAGLFIGFAVGVKLTNAPFAVAAYLMLVVLSCQSGWRATLRSSVYFIAACGVGFFFTAWWYWHLWTTWGSPVFPFYNAIFKSDLYPLVNFRDVRWQFSSVQEFATFLVQSAWATNKTSEVIFADARYLFMALLVPAAILCAPTARLNRKLVAFLVFMASSFLLWAFMFAYQRYLIPFELLLGLLIWVLVARVVSGYWRRLLLMFVLTLCAALVVKIPDWGHVSASEGANPFSVEINDNLSGTPARYMLVGQPLGYILPSFHPDSQFYGVGVSRQIDDLIFGKLTDPSDLPVRVLARDHNAELIPGLLKKVGYLPHENALDCDYFSTAVGRYVICEFNQQDQISPGVYHPVDVDYSAEGYLKFGGVLWERGLSHTESWGRWSDGEEVEFLLAGCLPQGRLKLTVTGRAFGPNSGLPFRVVVGGAEEVIRFGSDGQQQDVFIENGAGCADRITIKIPQPTSPQEVELSADTRQLGLGLTGLKLIKEL